ncbi:MAG: 5,10-methylenetetrahydrofolate reductase [Deltaproteobacteria bacterium]|nr:MAG: 5,10-methylenetetrahydrofolate reductase [Deltaproteobacteria bacterium]
MVFRERLRDVDFVKVVEVLPPKGTNGVEFERRLIPLKGLVDAFYLPSLQGAVLRASSWGAALFLQERGFETIFEISCIHRNRLAIQADLLGVGLLGLQNVMLLEGDDPKWGDHPEAEAVRDLGLMELIEAVRSLKEGKDLAGGDLDGAPDFCVGTKVNASLKDEGLEREWERMREMAERGVEFFVTTSVYDLGQLERFMLGASQVGRPVIAGLMVLKSAGMARYINKHVPGVLIPEETIDKLLRAPDKAVTSVKIAAETLRGIREVCQGVNIIPIGWEDKVPQILEEAGI